MTRIIA
jgi:hypothetical protein